MAEWFSSPPFFFSEHVCTREEARDGVDVKKKILAGGSQSNFLSPFIYLHFCLRGRERWADKAGGGKGKLS